MTHPQHKMPTWLESILIDNKVVQQVNKNTKKISFVSEIEKALIISTSYLQNPRPILIVEENVYHAQRVFERLSSFLNEDQCALFIADESLRVEAIANSPEMTACKVETMASLCTNQNQIVVTCPSALLRFLPKKEIFMDAFIHLKVNEEISMSELKRKLLAGGYKQTSHIDQPLSFAMRGGIVDVFSINYDQPIRIEFFDTEIDSIRFFNSDDQKTIVPVDEVQIVPASDVLFSDDQISDIVARAHQLMDDEERTISGDIESDLESIQAHIFERRMYPYMALLSLTDGIWDYMGFPTIFYCEDERYHSACKKLQEDAIVYIQEMVQEGKLLPRYSVYHDPTSIGKGCRVVYQQPFGDNLSGIESVHLPNESLSYKLTQIQNHTSILVLEQKEYEKVIETCVEAQIPYHLLVNDEIQPGINLYLGELAQGFYIREHDMYVYSSHELFELNHHKGRYENKFKNAEVIHHYQELETGDYIVHATYGVGQFIGIETREIQGNKRDFLKIMYRGNSELLVPLEQFRLVRKFVSREGVVPRLNKLGSGDWEKTKKRLQENVENIAGRLIDLYANRNTSIGYAFSPDTPLQEKFEKAFPYELTADQRQAVIDIKKDMESDKPMDRLVCGDVGFGKTEVSVIASFKAVSDGKQTAVLCPTTILAEQHYHTFCERYRDFPVEIRVLDRFVPSSQVKQTLQDLKDGKVDIVIGTHRLLSKDIVFKDLGLLIVDEEQRFGVEHKERIKELKNGIDVLTLSATPIPRTLQMSLVGIRQLSQLETPPLNRYSVQTYVVEKNDGLIKDAIEKELARDGQVFYLYNNIEQIYNVQRKLQELIPDCRYGVVHGRMGREEIEDIMFQFHNHEIDVLICTTIVENGIDVPNANTILIENAQDFGLAQIYQIKGRVGRSNRLAYAYLMIPPQRQLSEVAQKRLQAVKEFAVLGSGYKIAMRDLTIRGAGDLLGPSQSGFIDTVGIDMYIEMLENAIAAKKTGKPVENTEVTARANITKTSYIPASFAPDDFDKLDMYQKIDTVKSQEELTTYRLEVIDQYGKLPKEVNTLFLKKQLDLMLDDPIVESYKELKGKTEITFSPAFSQNVDGVRLFESFTKLSRDITIRYSNQCIIALLPKGKDDLNMAISCIQLAKESKKNEN